MGWLQVRRWLSFLPAAFVVYILLHYLVYQPDLTGPQPPVLVSGGRANNGSLVADALGPGTVPDARVLPPIVQDGEANPIANDTPTQSPAPQEPAASDGGQQHAEDSNTTQQHQGSATTIDSDSRSLTRFHSATKALGGVSFREPLSALPQQEDLSFLSDEGGLIGSGDLDTSPKGVSDESGTHQEEDHPHVMISSSSSNSNSILHGPPELDASSLSSSSSSSGGPRANIVMAEPPEDISLMAPSLSASSLTSSSPSSSSSHGNDANLLKDSPGSDLSPFPPSAIQNSSVVDTAKGLAYEHVLAHSMPSSHSDPGYRPSLTEYDAVDAQQAGDPLMYDQQNLRYPYQLYGEGYDSKYSPYQHFKMPEDMEEAMQRALYHQPRIEAGNLNDPPPPPHLPPLPPQVHELLPPRYDPYTHPRGQVLRAAQEFAPPQGRAGAPSNTAVRSTVQAVSSSSASGAAAADAVLPPQAAAVIAAAKIKPQPPNVVVVQGTGSAPQPRQTVTKKTTVVKTSNVASSSSVLSINALYGKTKVGEKYESGFSVPHEELCINNGRDLKVLVLITTAPDHEKHRTAVRQTWGHFAIRKDVVMAFVIGRTTNLNIQSNIDKENEIYGDIIQANFLDHYANLTLKTVSMFEWVKTYCSESHFVLKTDDDMFINMPLLLTFIDSKKADRRVMYGRLAKGWKPVRNKKSKYYIDTATYKKSKYPDFLTGPAYLFTSDIVDDIYQKALGTTFFVLEDVLVTGIVGESLRIRRVGDSRFRNEKIKLTDTCALMKTVSIHMVKYEEQFDIYKRTLDGKAKCKVG